MEEWLRAWVQPGILLALTAGIVRLIVAWRQHELTQAEQAKDIAELQRRLDGIYDREASPVVVRRLNELNGRVKGREDASHGGFQRLATAEADIKALRERQEEILRRLDALPARPRR